MIGNLSAEIRVILNKCREGKYEDAIKGFLILSDQDRVNEVAMMAYADALYELGNDVGSLEAYLKYVTLYPNGRAVDVALLGSAMALKNLDLQQEAFQMLQFINPKHNGLDEEIEHSNKVLSAQAEAKKILENIKWPDSFKDKGSE